KPIDGAWVELFNSQSNNASPTASNGAFSVPVPSGKYTLQVRFAIPGVSGIQRYRFSGAVTITGSRHENLTAPLHVTTLSVRDSHGAPVPDVSILPRWGAGCEGQLAPGLRGGFSVDTESSAFTDSAGQLRLAHPGCAGSATVSLMPSGGPGQQQSLSVNLGSVDRAQTV